MAKVKSMPSGNSQKFVVNDALTNVVSLEVCDESPPKYGIDLLLNEDNICFYQQPVDKGNTKKNETVRVVSSQCHISGNLPRFFPVDKTCVLELLQEESIQNKNRDQCEKKYLDNSVTMPPITSNCNNVVENSHISLSSLAQNHLNFGEKPQVLNDSCLDLEFTLEDLLSDIDGSSETIKSSEPSNANDDLNLCSVSFSSVKNDNMERKSQETFDDLSVLLDSSETHQQQSSFSLADLANTHFLNNLPSNADEYLKKNSSSVNIHCCENSDDSQFLSLNSLGNIFSPSKSEINLSKVKESLHVSPNRNSADVDESDNVSYSCNVSEDEIEPDINLSFCIKKPKNVLNDILTVVSVSPESSDSGFDETDSVSIKCNPSFQDFVSVQSTCPYEKDFKSPLTNPNPSLLSKTISCKSKLDKTKCKTLKNIRKKLYSQMIQTELFSCEVPHNARFQEIKDQSNQCVISSEITDQ